MSVSLRFLARRQHFAIEADLDVLGATIYDYYDEEGEHDKRGGAFLFLGLGARLMPTGIEPFSPYLTVIFHHVIETEHDYSFNALGFRAGASFIWHYVGFYFDGGLSWFLMDEEEAQYLGAMDWGYYPQISTGLIIGQGWRKKKSD